MPMVLARRSFMLLRMCRSGSCTIHSGVCASNGAPGRTTALKANTGSPYASSLPDSITGLDEAAEKLTVFPPCTLNSAN